MAVPMRQNIISLRSAFLADPTIVEVRNVRRSSRPANGDLSGRTEIYCYDCHEELLHNPVLLPQDVAKFAELVRLRQLSEIQKPKDRALLAGRIILLHEALSTVIAALLRKEKLSANPTIERNARKSGARPLPRTLRL